MKTILIPTDFSENGADAYEYTLNFIGDGDARIHVVNVVEPIVHPSDVPGMSVDINHKFISDAKESLATLEALANEFFKEKGKLHITTKVLVGQISTSIKEEAASINADLIIMGSAGAGHSNLEKFLGTVSSSVVGDSPCPVILVPIGYKFRDIDNVIFTTKLDHADPFELWKATDLMLPQISVIRCLYVAKDEEAKNHPTVAEFARYITEYSPSIQTNFHTEVSDEIEKTITEYAENYDAEMIVMHKSKKSFWFKLFGESHTKKMAFHMQIPLMIMNV